MRRRSAWSSSRWTRTSRAPLDKARAELKREMPGLALNLHAASEWGSDPDALTRCRADIAQGDIVIAGMLFMEDHFLPILADLEARRDACDAMVCALSAKEVVRLTRIGRFKMDGSGGGAINLLKKLRGAKKPGAEGGARQMAMLRKLPRILRLIPRHRAGRARLFPHAAILARRLAAEPRQHGPAAGRPLRRRHAEEPARSGEGPRRRSTTPTSASTTPRLKGRVGEKAEALPKAAGKTRHGRRAGHALLPSGREHRALRWRHRVSGSKGFARHSRLLGRPRQPSGCGKILLPKRAPGDRRAGLADRLSRSSAARPTTTPRRPRTFSLGSTSPTSPPTRPSSRPWSNGARRIAA